jgi:hypothetical protein
MGERKNKYAENDDEGEKKKRCPSTTSKHKEKAKLFLKNGQGPTRERKKKTLIGLAGRTLYVCMFLI